MKNTNLKTFTVLVAALFCAMTLMLPQSSTSAFAFQQAEKPKGEEKKGKNCESKGTDSSTFGKCEKVCKGKEVTRDAPNNRWVCSATLVRPRPGQMPKTKPPVSRTP